MAADGNKEATLGHTSIDAIDTVRLMKADAAPMPLHSSPGTEEDSGLLAINVEDQLWWYKVYHLIVSLVYFLVV